MPNSDAVDPAVPVEPAPFPQDLLDELGNDIIYDPEWEESDDDDSFLKSMFETYQSSIEELRRRILGLTCSSDPLIVVEEGGCGLTVWT